MSTISRGATWAVLVASKAAGGHETPQLLKRASSVADHAHICAIVADRYLEQWYALAGTVLPQNLFRQLPGENTQKALARMLDSLSERDAQAQLIVIPADHCAAEENAWVSCAQNAVRFGVDRLDTVFVLHDNPENDPRTSLHYPGVCSSSVMIGSLRSIRDLCAGAPAMAIVDLNVDRPDDVDGSDDQRGQNDARGAASVHAQPGALRHSAPLKVIHITSVDEYAKLQRGDYGRARSLIDLHA